MKINSCVKRMYVVILLLFVCLFNACGSRTNTQVNEYGVFIGVDPEDSDILREYKAVVIDGAYYSDEEITQLRQYGIKIYSYLNIGSIETFREEYPVFQELILGEYENWPDEYWVDVSKKEWQDHIGKQAAALVGKGIDGFFLDNADVYDLYPTSEIRQGLVKIISGLEKYQKEIIMNGGDVFVSESILDAESPLVHISGVNQECVFSDIDFENNLLREQDDESSEYYKKYLQRCDKKGLSVYLTEYIDEGNEKVRKKVESYCQRYQFSYFISTTVLLINPAK